MLCGLAAMMQASGFGGVAFDPVSFQQNGLATPQADAGQDQVGDALVVPGMVAVGEEVADLLLGIADNLPPTATLQCPTSAVLWQRAPRRIVFTVELTVGSRPPRGQ